MPDPAEILAVADGELRKLPISLRPGGLLNMVAVLAERREYVIAGAMMRQYGMRESVIWVILRHYIAQSGDDEAAIFAQVYGWED